MFAKFANMKFDIFCDESQKNNLDIIVIFYYRDAIFST